MHLLLSPPLFPAGAIKNRWAPVVGIVNVKDYIFEGERAGLHCSLERCPSSCPSHYFMVRCNTFLPLLLDGRHV